ncbi:MAG: hypothetical protein SRB1_02023 [Desulfobacteraceae bacterium Eth-SRB1]|nr:MAG: hypothetical protein SRB1_02023 [Desulfobacteraceae bacterium Eth-SRB1]
MKKKLLFIGAYPPPYGGIATHLYELLPELVKNGYDVISLTDTRSHEQTLQCSGMKNLFINSRKYFFKNILMVSAYVVVYLRYKRDLSWKNFIKVVNFTLLVRQVAKKENINTFFYYHIEEGLIIPILKKCFDSSCAHIWMIFGECYVTPEKYRGISRYLKNAFSQTDVILASSRYCADSISIILGFNFPVEVIYIGIDDKKYLPSIQGDNLRNEMKIPFDAPVFLFFGRMIRDMGVDFILEVSDQLLHIHSNVHLVVAGAYGDFSNDVERLSKLEPRVHYCPDIPFERKIDYYASCNVFLAPTLAKRACMGVSIKEAMACGKPILASNSGGIPEAVEDDVNGYLIPFKDGKLDADIFINRARQLINDQSLQIIRGKMGRQKVLKLFTNDQTIQKYLNILERVL